MEWGSAGDEEAVRVLLALVIVVGISTLLALGAQWVGPFTMIGAVGIAGVVCVLVVHRRDRRSRSS
jgi:hypothetical protein